MASFSRVCVVSQNFYSIYSAKQNKSYIFQQIEFVESVTTFLTNIDY